MQPVQGIHHITAVASDPQRNLDFYRGILGQRFVKRTVNFDDPSTYHFYFADQVGSPGTVLTFFPWRSMGRGVRGNGEVGATAYAIRAASVDFWRNRLTQHGVDVQNVGARFGQDVLAFADPDGMAIELIVDDEDASFVPWDNGPIPGEHELRGFHSATLWVDEIDDTETLLTEALGYTRVESTTETAGETADGASERARYRGASDDMGRYVDLLARPGMGRGRMGAGSVHHIALRTVDDSEQVEYKTLLHKRGYGVSPVMDRQYFHSIYFRAPSGVLFEVATDAPGFLYDEPVDELGTHLKLPNWLESRRDEIERMVAPIELKPLSAQRASQGGANA